jgi:hypothetical protein
VSAELALGFMAAIALIAFAAIVVQSRPLRGGLTTTGIVVGAERRRTTQLSNATGGRGADLDLCAGRRVATTTAATA